MTAHYDRGDRILRPLFGAMMAAISLSVVAGCTGDDPQAGGLPGVDGGEAGTECIDSDGDGYGIGCPKGPDCDDTDPETKDCIECALNEPGCPCDTEGMTMACGVEKSTVGSATTCAYGVKACRDGVWGECIPSPSGKPSSLRSLGTATECDNNPCDPYCVQYCDTTDPTMGSGELVANDGGVSLPWDPDGGGSVDAGSAWIDKPNGPLPSEIEDILNDAGATPDPNAIYHEALPGEETDPDPFNVQANVNTIDVYFLVDTTASMSDEINALANSIASTGGIIDTIRGQVPDAWFGVGHFEEFKSSPWNGGSTNTKPYEHVLNITEDKAVAQTAATWLTGQIHGNSSFPEAWGPAMYSVATGNGLYKNSSSWWAPPHDATWDGPSTFSPTGACPAGTLGYPCFRDTATPVTVLISDAPSHNGPGGMYAYTHDSSWGVEGAASWPAASAVTGNNTEATAREILDIKTFSYFSGSTSSSGNNKTYPGPNWIDCNDSGTRGGNGNDVFYKFTVTERTPFHFDTLFSSFDTVLYMYKAGNTGVVCNNTSYLGGDDGSIDGVVEAGTYYVVVDGRYSSSNGSYYLRVNAMDDGTVATLPNWNQQFEPYDAIGGKLIGIDSSGWGCTGGHQDNTQENTGTALKEWAYETGAVNGSTGVPYVFKVSKTGGPCNSGDPNLADSIANAVIDLTEYSRVDVSVEAFDTDDATDFDGPPGGATTLTPVNVDDATFLKTVTTIQDAETDARCQQTLPNKFVQCLPGTHVKFNIVFETPATLSQLDHAQIFKFDVRVVADGSSVLGSNEAVIVVPPAPGTVSTGSFTGSDFVREFDTNNVCPPGSQVVWAALLWDSIAPYDSSIEFFVSSAQTQAGLDSAPEFLAAAARSTPPPSTEIGTRIIHDVFVDNNHIARLPVLRVRARLNPSSDGLAAPTLFTWKQEMSCQPSE